MFRSRCQKKKIHGTTQRKETWKFRQLCLLAATQIPSNFSIKIYHFSSLSRVRIVHCQSSSHRLSSLSLAPITQHIDSRRLNFIFISPPTSIIARFPTSTTCLHAETRETEESGGECDAEKNFFPCSRGRKFSRRILWTKSDKRQLVSHVLEEERKWLWYRERKKWLFYMTNHRHETAEKLAKTKVWITTAGVISLSQKICETTHSTQKT